ncbi:MAG: FAD-dependent oxidoreductase [Rhodospirillum sp.]|nr:FAD-dependent oxidoreductase [Rhodospirillum sp.]MCF8503240.1 FAD-dependent oxidoreductase [Rhodospirillum sp.]
MIGLREPDSRAFDARSPPDPPYAIGLTPEGEAEDVLLDAAPAPRRFPPGLDAAPLARFVEGLSTYTPDGNFVVGTCPGAPGLVLVTGCNGAGIAMAGGLGRLAAALALGQDPGPLDPAPHAPDRFGSFDPFSPAWLARRAEARSGKRSG